MSFLNVPTTIVRRANSITVTPTPASFFAGATLIGKNDIYVQSAQQTGVMSWFSTVDSINNAVTNQVIASNVLSYTGVQPGSVTFQITPTDPFISIFINTNGSATINTNGGSQVISYVNYSQNLLGSLL